MNTEKEFSAEESLRLIKSMIEQTKGTFADKSFYFLFWGWLVFFCCLLQFILKVWLQYPNHYMVWWLMPAGGVISFIYSLKVEKKKAVKSPLQDSLEYLWIGLFFAYLVITFINTSTQNWQFAFTHYILLFAIGTYISGSIMKFKPLVYGGIVNFFLAALSIKFSYDYQILFCALAIAASYIIPGHLMKLKYKSQH